MANPVTIDQLKSYSISGGAFIDPSYGVLAVTSDERLKRDPEDDHSYFAVTKDDVWYLFESAFPVTSVAYVGGPSPEVISISKAGGVRRAAKDGSVNEAKIGEAPGEPVFGRTVMVEVKGIAGHAYAVGTRRSAYRREAEGRWTCIDRTCYVAESDGSGFYAIDGFSPTDLYAVGANGEIWRYDGRGWARKESPTNADLLCVVCGGDGLVYAAGMNGALVRGRDDRWQVLDEIDPGYRFYSIAEFEGRVYLSANLSLLFELLPSAALDPMDLGDVANPGTTNQMIRCGSTLYSIGPKEVLRCDGTAWEYVLKL